MNYNDKFKISIETYPVGYNTMISINVEIKLRSSFDDSEVTVPCDRFFAVYQKDKDSETRIRYYVSKDYQSYIEVGVKESPKEVMELLEEAMKIQKNPLEYLTIAFKNENQ